MFGERTLDCCAEINEGARGVKRVAMSPDRDVDHVAGLEKEPSTSIIAPQGDHMGDHMEESSIPLPEDGTGSNISGDDECSICLSVLCRPVRPATCSHMFCAVCIYKAGLRSRCCPLCRAPFAEDFNINALEVVPGADERLSVQYPAEHAHQRKIHDAEWEQIQEAIRKMTKNVMLFIMPSSNVEPNVHIQLHLFEPRYRYLTARALSTGAKFGWVLQGNGQPGSIGRLCSIVHHRLNPDGTFDVVLHIDELFRTESISTIEIRQQNNEEYPPLYVADITILPNSTE